MVMFRFQIYFFCSSILRLSSQMISKDCPELEGFRFLSLLTKLQSQSSLDRFFFDYMTGNLNDIWVFYTVITFYSLFLKHQKGIMILIKSHYFHHHHYNIILYSQIDIERKYFNYPKSQIIIIIRVNSNSMQDLNSHSDNSDHEEQDGKSQEDETFYMNFTGPNFPQESQQDNEKQQNLNIPQSEDGFIEKIHRQIQLIYIAKYSPDYRQTLESLAFHYGCGLNFGKNSFTISCKDKKKKQSWTICKQIIVKEFDKIIYKKVEDKDKRFRLLHSAQVNKYASQQGIYFCQFNSEIYLHSNRYTPQELDKKKLEISKYCNIFSVCFNKKKNIQTIDSEIAKFYRTVLEEYYNERFEKNKMVVEVNRLDRTFYILGKPGATAQKMMEAKNTMKNLIEGITIVAFKNVTLDLKAEIKLKDYLKKISKYPITYGKLSQTVFVLISKDNIMRQFLKKTDKITQKLCVRQDTAIGIYMPFCYSRQEKRQKIYKICKDEGYDFWSNWGIRYFRPMIASQDDVKNPTQILNLIIRIIAGFIEVKETYELLSEKKPASQIDAKKKKQLEEQDKYAYILKNLPKDSIELSKALMRDVMQDEVHMMKRYNVIYNLLEGNEIGPYYIDQVQYDKGVGKGQIKLIEKQSLKKGQYFEVYLKIVPEEAGKSLAEIEEMLVQEMKKLKKAAKLDKQEGKSFDSQRKIAHMIKKQLDVF